MAAERVEQALDELGKRMQSVEKQHDELVQRLQTYEKLAADTVRIEISKVTGGLNDLYTKADAAIGSLAIRVQALEKSYIQGARQKTSLLNAKDMKPKELEKEEDWRRWKADVEDCVEEIMPGMKDILEKVAINTKAHTMEGTQDLWKLEKSLLTLKVPGVNIVKSQFL